MRLPMNPAVTGLTLSGIRRFTALAAQTPGCVKLTLGEPEFDTPLPIRQAAQRALEQSDTHYPPNNGRPELLAALSEFSKKQGLDYTPEEFVVTCGATEALLCALSGVVDVGDEVLVPIPAFGLYESLIGLCRGVYKPVDTEPCGFQLNEQALNAAVSERTKAIILTSPNNPTGCVYTRASLDAVAELVRRTGIYVICDDVYWQLSYTDSFARFCCPLPGSEGEHHRGGELLQALCHDRLAAGLAGGGCAGEAAAAEGAPVQRGQCDQLFPDCLHRRIGKRCERHAPELPAAAGLCL